MTHTVTCLTSSNCFFPRCQFCHRKQNYSSSQSRGNGIAAPRHFSSSSVSKTMWFLHLVISYKNLFISYKYLKNTFCHYINNIFFLIMTEFQGFSKTSSGSALPVTPEKSSTAQKSVSSKCCCTRSPATTVLACNYTAVLLLFTIHLQIILELSCLIYNRFRLPDLQ